MNNVTMGRLQAAQTALSIKTIIVKASKIAQQLSATTSLSVEMERKKVKKNVMLDLDQ